MSSQEWNGPHASTEYGYQQSEQGIGGIIEYPLEVAQQMARERDELRAQVTWLKTGLERKTQELETAMAEVQRLRAALP